MKPRAYVFIRQILTQLLNAHLVYRLSEFGKRYPQAKKKSYYDIKIMLNKMDSFSSTLESMFECWKYIELCNLINEREQQKEKKTNTNKQNNNESTTNNYDDVLSQLPKNFRIKFG